MTFHDIPKPSASDLKRSETLSEKIRNEILNQGGFISFSTFMNLALYEPILGYYERENLSLGKNGDFTTAPEISPLFAQCFALQCKEIWGNFHEPFLLELGAGSGRFAKDFLLATLEMNCLPNFYYIYEPSHSLKQQQKNLLQEMPPSLSKRIIWLESLPTHFKGIMIANEVLDALPTHCFSLENNQIKERCVSIMDDQFIFSYQTPTTPLLEKAALKFAKEYQWSNHYSSEINLSTPPFIKKISNILTAGVILLADYGYGQDEYYHRDRVNGTLTSFYKHRQSHHPLYYPGLFDITSHVNFTQVVENAVDSSANLLGYTTQASFLLACGLMDFAKEIEKNLSPKDEVNFHQAIKLLTLPMEMGERIKIMALGKSIDFSLRGFWHDRRRDL